MKKAFYLFTLLAFASCKESRKNILIGKWQLLNVSDRYMTPGYVYDSSISTQKLFVTYLSDSIYVTENQFENRRDSFQYRLSNDTLYSENDFHIMKVEGDKVFFSGGKRNHQSTIIKASQ